MNAKIIKDMDKLQKDYEGWYDSELDMYFDTLVQWLGFKWNKTFAQIL
ncbi:MAG: hypothetical protein RSH78_03890 [Bacilli bacterium]